MYILFLFLSLIKPSKRQYIIHNILFLLQTNNILFIAKIVILI